MADMYRDRADGAAARRLHLLQRRREELATLPHAVRRVVVARAARSAAGLAAAGLGALLVAAAWSGSVGRLVERVLPGDEPSAQSTIFAAVWLVALVAWALSRGRSEHRFAVAMSLHVLPTADVDHDVERLDHERPDAIARAMGHRLEVSSVVWPVLASAVLVPATAAWLWSVLRIGGWPTTTFDLTLRGHGGAFAIMFALGGLGAIAATRAGLRQASVAWVALPLGALAWAGAVVTFTRAAWLSPWLAGVGSVALALGALVWRLGRERALLAVDDPAAGSELFTLRGAWRACRVGLGRARAGLGRVRTALLGLRPRTWLALGAAGAVSVAIGLARRPGPATIPPPPTAPTFAVASPVPPPPPVPSPVVAPPPAAVAAVAAVAPTLPTEVTVRQRGDRLEIEAVLDEHGARVVPLGGLAEVPAGWAAALRITLVGDQPVGVTVDPEDLDRSLVPLARADRYVGRLTTTSLTLVACHGPRPFALHLLQPDGAGTRVRLSVIASVRPTVCGR